MKENGFLHWTMNIVRGFLVLANPQPDALLSRGGTSSVTQGVICCHLLEHKNMRITHVILSAEWGGTERIVVDICSSLAEYGHKIQLVCNRRFEARKALESLEGIRVDTVNPWPKAVKNLDFVSVFRMRNLVRNFKPALIHTHLKRGMWAGGIVGKLLKCPVVTTVHTNFRRKYIKNVNHFLVTAEHQRPFLNNLRVPGEEIHKIPNFSTFEPVGRIAELKWRTPVFAGYGRFGREKGFSYLLYAFKRFLDIEGKGRLLLGGDGPERETLVQLTKELGIEDAVEFRGWIKDVEGFLSQCNIVVIPSVQEQFGVAVLEAMARGVPIVATRAEGPSEILDDHTAFMADVADPESLYRAMRDAASDPAATVRKAENALNIYKTTYTKSAVLPQMIEYYRRVASSGKSEL